MLNFIKQSKLIFWDFDGVIKESVEIKTEAFVKLFKPFGRNIEHKVRLHHLNNGGMSRFDKIPLYLSWVDKEANKETVEKYCNKFSKLVVKKVVMSNWVPGVEKFLRKNSYKQIFILVSATPQKELEEILSILDITKCFDAIFGAPFCKQNAIKLTLFNKHMLGRDCLMIGDSQVDIDASEVNQVPFLLRKHMTNKNISNKFKGRSVDNFFFYG
jgi:phosphoglycolate phosphatase-like HAD superfamily hydrolase